VCADINVGGASIVAEAIVGEGGSAIAIEVDIAEEASVRRWSTARSAGVDILVNNAALNVDGGFDFRP
jgi:NAD(P)-dependent dehydrogenase (short-subunit alcohol dehydrogenase family)